MLMKDDKKKMATIIMAGLKKPSEEAPLSEDGGLEDSSVALETAAHELMSALESKSAKGVVEAIKSLMELCEQEEPEEQQEEK